MKIAENYMELVESSIQSWEKLIRETDWEEVSNSEDKRKNPLTQASKFENKAVYEIFQLEGKDFDAVSQLAITFGKTKVAKEYQELKQRYFEYLEGDRSNTFGYGGDFLIFPRDASSRIGYGCRMQKKMQIEEAVYAAFPEYFFLKEVLNGLIRPLYKYYLLTAKLKEASFSFEQAKTSLNNGQNLSKLAAHCKPVKDEAAAEAISEVIKGIQDELIVNTYSG